MPDLRFARRPPPVSSGTAVQALAPAQRCILRGDEAVRAAAERALGLTVPASACRAAAEGERAALWLGPDEWLLIAPASAAAEPPAALAQLTAALAGLPHSLVDVSHRQCALAVSGPEAATLLAAGCPLDLHESAFPVGMCTRTMLAKAEVVLWRTAAQSFRLEVWRSFVDYVARFLAEAARGNSAGES
jgi:sarcosine oxidase, subunit gamma